MTPARPHERAGQVRAVASRLQLAHPGTPATRVESAEAAWRAGPAAQEASASATTRRRADRTRPRKIPERTTGPRVGLGWCCFSMAAKRIHAIMRRATE